MGEWQRVSGGNVPGNAFHAGNEGDIPVYVGRASYQGDLLPGKVTIGKGWFPYGGAEIEINDFEVLVGGNYSWVGYHPSAPQPGNAVPGGNTSSGETLYIGRASRDGKHVVGKYHPSHRKLYVPYFGVEYSYENFDILVRN